MDGYEATRIVFSRIQNLDPENASKIMGLLLIQDHGEKEMIRLAFGPEALVHSVVVKARSDLGLLPSNSPSTPSTPSSPSPFLSATSNPVPISRQNSTSSKLLHCTSATTSTPSLSELQCPSDLISSSTSLPFYGNGGSDPIEEFQLQDQLSFLNDGSSPTLGPKSPDLFYPPQSDLSSSPTGAALGAGGGFGWGGGSAAHHRRSCSVNDACLGSEELNSGLGWKPCLYFARGYCKNGNTCRFLHGGLGDGDGASMVVGSPSKMEMVDQCHELLRSKSVQQQRLAAASQLMASSFPYSPKCMNLLLQQQQNDSQRAAAALMMNEDLHKFGRSRLERSEFSLNGGPGMVNPASRQIYLTFPADSTFREEDVSNYFSIYGPVQDVRIPYQQKRMFGFVTFVYPETVKLILSKGNPHFVCDARVLVKPYKEKGKVPDKYRKQQQQQQVDRGDFSPCGTPTGLDARDPFDLQLGGRMYYNTQDMLWRRKLEEQADLQQALEFQSRRLMGLQLLDIKKQHHRALSTGSPIPSPTQSPNMFSQNLVLPPFHSSTEAPEESVTSSAPPSTASIPVDQQPLQQAINVSAGKEVTVNGENGNTEGNGKQSSSSSHEDRELQECLDHNLPDSPFASPTKAAGDYMAAFSCGPNEAIGSDASVSSANSKFGNSSLLPAASALDMGSFKSFNCQLPRFSSGHGTIGMFAAGTGGGI
ncbi:zinc finger CCCH domain-containing protein 53 isoform X1 [Neltuma alba]|uniref:zinc finger CCCH domain-containing protein 53 isoform X1 n=1 Tax=Neltuma alba TaxID=207710 RepID=UPI0010A31D74|nr:zinc finger CCCH domain-containing protein 53-like isoform X1 [Prosopis alba]